MKLRGTQNTQTVATPKPGRTSSLGASPLLFTLGGQPAVGTVLVPFGTRLCPWPFHDAPSCGGHCRPILYMEGGAQRPSHLVRAVLRLRRRGDWNAGLWPVPSTASNRALCSQLLMELLLHDCCSPVSTPLGHFQKQDRP